MPNIVKISPFIGFSIRLVAIVGFLCAAQSWIFFQSNLFETSDFPLRFVPSDPWLGLGLIIGPLIGIVMFIALLILMLCSPPRPLFGFVFVGCLGFIFFAWDDPTSFRLSIVLAACSIFQFAESVVRQLPRSQLIASLLSVGICFVYVFFLMCAVAVDHLHRSACLTVTQ